MGHYRSRGRGVNIPKPPLWQQACSHRVLSHLVNSSIAGVACPTQQSFTGAHVLYASHHYCLNRWVGWSTRLSVLYKDAPITQSKALVYWLVKCFLNHFALLCFILSWVTNLSSYYDNYFFYFEQSKFLLCPKMNVLMPHKYFIQIYMSPHLKISSDTTALKKYNKYFFLGNKILESLRVESRLLPHIFHKKNYLCISMNFLCQIFWKIQNPIPHHRA